jgi:enoyl-CoA hydratase/carnithine racemase
MTTTPPGSPVSDDLVIERRGGVLIARLNRPEARNALNRTILHGFTGLMAEAENDPEIRAIVLTGTGDRAFCAGMDLRDFAEGAQEGNDDPDAMNGFWRLIKGEATVPIIGAINATAVAGGFELLLGCDLIVASSEAKFGLPEVKRGLFPAGWGTFLGTRIPLSIALEMTLTGDSIDAERAYQLGLVNAVVPPGEVLATAISFAERIALNGPLAVRVTKELVRLGVTDAPRARSGITDWQTRVFNSEDAKEGAAAFVERRAPVWKGR